MLPPASSSLLSPPTSLPLPSPAVQVGDYYFDADAALLYYAAASGSNPAQSSFIIPVNETLVHAAPGTTDVNFTGVVFEHGGWTKPNGPAGFVDDQAGVQAEASSVLLHETVAANLVFEGGVSNILFVNCTFQHLGAAAVHFKAGSHNNAVQHSTFTDISAAAVQVGEIDGWNATETSKQTWNNTVADCTMLDVPNEYHGAVPVTVFVAAGTQVLHNEIGGSSYSAITVGWGWHTEIGNTSYARHNSVVGNYIHDSMQLLFDGGDIYTLGSQPGSVAAQNHVKGHHNCVKTNGLYHDDGSAHWTDRHNVIQFLEPPTPCTYRTEVVWFCDVCFFKLVFLF